MTPKRSYLNRLPFQSKIPAVSMLLLVTGTCLWGRLLELHFLHLLWTANEISFKKPHSLIQYILILSFLIFPSPPIPPVSNPPPPSALFSSPLYLLSSLRPIFGSRARLVFLDHRGLILAAACLEGTERRGDCLEFQCVWSSTCHPWYAACHCKCMSQLCGSLRARYVAWWNMLTVHV